MRNRLGWRSYSWNPGRECGSSGSGQKVMCAKLWEVGLGIDAESSASLHTSAESNLRDKSFG